jgi:hypothetical protein
LSKWYDGDLLPNVRLRGFSFRQRARWFAKVWKQCLKHLNFAVELAYCKPKSHIILMYTGCAALPWPAERLAQIDDWMMKCSGGAFKRQTKAIDSLPFADKQLGVPPVFLATSGTCLPKTGSSRDHCWPHQKMEKNGGLEHGFYFPYIGNNHPN